LPLEKRTIDGVSLAYRITGEGRPVVLIHGLTANMRDWFRNVKPLAEAGFRVLTPDLPGHGGSSAPQQQSVYAMAHIADVLHELASELGFAPAAVVGHSMGGAVAEEYAVRHSEDVSALVLVDSAGGSPRAYVRTPQMVEFAELERNVAFAQGMGAVWDLHQERGMWASVKGLQPQVQKFLKSRFCECSPQGYIYGDRQMNERRNTISDLRTFLKKSLVICGENEATLLKGTSAELAAALPNATFVEISKAGHSPQFENADVFNASLIEFLDRL
jgi:pimeloyl-ACP methyl ester carboxylesterase